MTEKRDFDAVAASWDEEPRRVKLAQEVAAAIMAAVPLSTETAAMDFGCGTGLLTLLLQPRVGTITGVDSSSGMLAVLERKVAEQGLPNVRTVLCDVEQGGWLEGEFHLIVSSMTLHHVADIAPLVKSFHERLLPGGFLCLADLDREDGTFHSDPAGVMHFGFGRDEIRTVMAECGFTDIRDTTAAVIAKESPAAPREYPVFLICGRKGHTGFATA